MAPFSQRMFAPPGPAPAAPRAPQISLQPPFDSVCLSPDLNCDPIIAKFTVQPPIPPPPSLAHSEQAADFQLRHSTAALEACINVYLLAADQISKGDSGARNAHVPRVGFNS